VPESIRFGDGFELDTGAYQLRRAGRVLKLERIPIEILLFLAEQPGEIVTREQIVERVWGKDVFLDTDNSINGAIRKIRQVLKDDPEEPRFIQTVTGKGYRFIAQVVARAVEERQAAGEAMASVVTQDSPIPSPAATEVFQARPAWYRRWTVVAFASLLLVAGASYAVWSRRPVRVGSAPPSRVMLAVLPFANLTGDASQEYFSDGLTEEMISELGQINPEHLGVIGRTSVMLYKTNPKSLDQIGRELGVQYVIEGSVRRDSEHVRITAQLIQVKDQTHVWAKEYDRELKNLLAVQAEIAEEIRDEIELTIGGQKPIPAKGEESGAVATTSYEAYDLYLRGRYFWNKRTAAGFLKAADYFQQAFAKDPGFAQAYAGLADTYGLMSTWHHAPQSEFMPRARAAAQKALQLDEKLAEAHTSLALVAESYDYDWPAAEKEFRRAIELNPYYATAHQWYAEFLAWQGRFEEARAESERARQLDPLSVIIARDHAAVYYYSRQYDRAIEQSRAVLEMDPSLADWGLISSSLVQQGKYAEALDEIERRRLTNDPTRFWAYKANIYGRWGRTADAEQALAKVKELIAHRLPDQSDRLLLAYAGMGRKDEAIALLQNSYAKRSNVVLSIKVDPEYDPLRGDPRFQELLRRLRFAP
jgi:TolB-like protein/DNA-binding winged helix-turn-helix (wHTH) protein/Flp pilus assembly protein TadD